METWRENALPGHTHDPNEVTVQIDGLGHQLADLSAEPGREGAAEGPVFVDETGRRSRRFRRLGVAVGIACAVYAAVIAGTLLSGSSSAPWLPMPEPRAEKPASKVDVSDRPEASADPSASSASPDGSPSPGATDSLGAKPGPGADGGPRQARGGEDGDEPDAAPDSAPAGGGRPAPGPDLTDGGGPATAPTGGGPGSPDPGRPTDPVTPPAEPPTQPTESGGSGGVGAGGSGGSGGGEVPVGYTPSPEQSATDTQPSSTGTQQS